MRARREVRRKVFQLYPTAWSIPCTRVGYSVDILHLLAFIHMAYYQPPEAIVKWDKGGGARQGVSITRQLEDGKQYVWRIPFNGVVTQAMAADVLGVSLMTINNWVNSGVLMHIKPKGQPSVVPLSEIKRVRNILLEHGRLRRDALGQ
jgi:hypothetical protein